ncbi:nucleotidyl transferase family protein [Tannockella kyphosi]|uniref:hypothetical protein n=1 Tax=Tannockella kyphosi TaxID=2899121 RepID=UPI0020126631|nr:hypothetical protein [Tannockella kyphosi]
MKKIIVIIVGIVLLVGGYFLFTNDQNMEGEYTIEEVVYLTSLSSYSIDYYNDLIKDSSVVVGDTFSVGDEVIYTDYELIEDQLETILSDEIDGLFESDYEVYSIVADGQDVRYGMISQDEDLYLLIYMDEVINSISLLK